MFKLALTFPQQMEASYNQIIQVLWILVDFVIKNIITDCPCSDVVFSPDHVILCAPTVAIANFHTPAMKISLSTSLQWWCWIICMSTFVVCDAINFGLLCIA